MTDAIDRAQPVAPPHDNLAECVTLGAMLLSPAVADTITETLTASDFYRPVHGTIFDAIVRLMLAGEPVDPLTVASDLAEAGDLQRVGGAPYLHTLVESVPTAANGPHYARQVAEAAEKRRISEAGIKAQRLATGPGEMSDIREQAQEAMYAATTAANERAPMTFVGDLAGPSIAQVERLSRGEVPPGIATGLSDLDRLLLGLRPGQLIIPAGRTSMGKSVVTQNWLVHAVMTTQRPVVLFSVEMSKDEMMLRILSQMSRVPLHALISGNITDEDRTKLARAEDMIAPWPLVLVDSCRTVPAIRSFTRRFRQRMGDLAMVGVDYLQRLTPTDRRADRHVVVGEFADQLKDLAQDMAVPVIAPCQLNRGPETRPGKDANRPRLADLRESGNLEQTADVVVLLHRPSYYDKTSPRVGEADFIVAKSRNGPTDTVTVAEQLHVQRFVDMSIVEPTPGGW